VKVHSFDSFEADWSAPSASPVLLEWTIHFLEQRVERSQPARQPYIARRSASVRCLRDLLVNKHHTDTNCKNGENYSGYEVQRPPPSAFWIKRWGASDAAAKKHERGPQAGCQGNEKPNGAPCWHSNCQKDWSNHISLKHSAFDATYNPKFLEAAIEHVVLERQCHDVCEKREPRGECKRKQEQGDLSQSQNGSPCQHRQRSAMLAIELDNVC